MAAPHVEPTERVYNITDEAILVFRKPDRKTFNPDLGHLRGNSVIL